MSVYFALVVLLPVPRTGGTARNMYLLFPSDDASSWALMIAWTRGSDAGLSMDGGLKGSSYR